MIKSEEIIKRRNVIVEKLKLVENEALIKKATDKLLSFLGGKHKSVTPERLNILAVIYKLSGPADPETIHKFVENDFGHVSLSTVYYVIELLLNAKLIRKLNLVEGGPFFYEKTIDTENHAYSICSHCGKVRSLSMKKYINDLKTLPAQSFNLETISLIFYGECRNCASKRNKQLKQNKK